MIRVGALFAIQATACDVAGAILVGAEKRAAAVSLLDGMPG
jgi:hypothetical protein